MSYLIYKEIQFLENKIAEQENKINLQIQEINELNELIRELKALLYCESEDDDIPF